MSECLGHVFLHVCSLIIQTAKIVVRFFHPELGGALVQFDGPRHVLLQSVLSVVDIDCQDVDCHWIACVDSFSDHGEDWLSSGVGVRQNGQSLMPRFRAAKMQPLHTFFMQHALNIDCFHRAAKAAGRSGSRPPPTSCGPSSSAPAGSPRPRTPRIAVMLCLSPRCSSLYEPSGSSRSHAPQTNFSRQALEKFIVSNWNLAI